MNKKVYDCIECALPHKCQKETDTGRKCAQCEIGYKFIAYEPMSLQCGHLVCNQCTDKIKNGAYKCKICLNEMVSFNVPASASDCLIELKMKQLTELLKEKYKQSLKILTGKLR